MKNKAKNHLLLPINAPQPDLHANFVVVAFVVRPRMDPTGPNYRSLMPKTNSESSVAQKRHLRLYSQCQLSKVKLS